MNYSPDYNMRRRNQECGCNRSMARQENNRIYPKENCRMPQQEACRMPQQEPCRMPCQEPERKDCGCEEKTAPKCESRKICLDAYPVGMAYVPWQVWQELYNLEEGFQAGTIFRELDYPWEVGRCARCR